jgi:hypothetical protein
MRGYIPVQSLRQCLQRVIDRRACADSEQNASAGRGAVRDLNPHVIVIGVDAGHLQQPFVETDAQAPLIQRAEPSIHDLCVTTVTHLLSGHACSSSTTGASSGRQRVPAPKSLLFNRLRALLARSFYRRWADLRRGKRDHWLNLAGMISARRAPRPVEMRAGRIPGIRRAAGPRGRTRPPTPERQNPAGRQSTAPALTAGDIHVAAGKGRLCGRSAGSWRRSGRAAWMGRQRRARKRRLRCYRVLRTPPARAPSAFESQSRDWPDAAAGRLRRYVVDSA